MAGGMMVGLFGLHRGTYPDGTTLARRVRAVEEAGFESIWVGDHIVMPEDTATDRLPTPAGMPRLEAVVALTYMAAHTSRVRLATGVFVLPQRHPLLLAKQLATLDVLSGGRLIVGIGVGWLEPELRAMGVAMSERGSRTDEYLAAMRAIWSEGAPTFEGRHVSFAGVAAHPPPAQRPHPPIVVGGTAPAAYRRAVEQANGWYGFEMDLDTTARALAGLRRAAEHHRRASELGDLEITITPPAGPVDRATAERYRALGVHRLVLLPRELNDDAALASYIDSAKRELIGAV